MSGEDAGRRTKVVAMDRPWGFFWSNSAVLAASVLVGLRIVPGFGMPGIMLAFYALFIMPGIVVWRLAPGGAGINIDGVARVFLTGLATAACVVCLGFIPHVNYPTISIVYASLTAVGLVALLVRSPRRQKRRIPFPGRDRTARSESRLMFAAFALFFVICSILLYGSAETGVATDAPDHLSFIRRSLDSGELLPRDSFYRDGDGAVFDQRKGLWHPVAALWSWQSDVPSDTLWRAVPAMLGFFAIVVFWGFAGELVGGVPMKLLALAFLLLVFRGQGAGWLSKLGYSRNIAMVIAWGSIMAVLKYLRGSRRLDLAAAALWTAAGAAVHAVLALVMGAFLLSLAIYTLFTVEGRVWRRRFAAAAAALVAALAVPVVIRVLHDPGQTNLIHRHLQGMLLLGGGLRTIDPIELVLRYDRTILFACAIVPFVFFLGRDRGRERLVGTLFIVPAILTLLPFTATFLERIMGYFYIRILNAAPAACLLAMAASGLGAVVVRPRHLWAARLAAAGALIIMLAALRPSAARFEGELLRFAARSTPHASEGHRIAEALERLPRHSVIASDPATSYLVSAFTDHFVVVTIDQHGAPSDMTALDRMARTRDLLDPGLPIEASAGWLSSEGVDFVLFDRSGYGYDDFFGVTALLEPEAVLAKLRSRPEYLTEQWGTGGMHLFAVNDASGVTPGAVAGQRPPGPLREGALVTDIPGSIDLAGFEAGPDTVAAGDSVMVSFLWVLDDPIRFGLPFYWTLRFDTQFPRGAMYREWYGKQYRRFVERRRGEFYRYTAAGRIAAGTALPHTWPAGEPKAQTVSFALPRAVAPGNYTISLSVERRPYIPNRTPADYLRNEDSLQGRQVATIVVVPPRGERD